MNNITSIDESVNKTIELFKNSFQSIKYSKPFLESLSKLTARGFYCLPKRKDKKNFQGQKKSLSSASEKPFPHNYRNFSNIESAHVSGIAIICDSTANTWAIDIDLPEKFKWASTPLISGIESTLMVYKERRLSKAFFKGNDVEFILSPEQKDYLLNHYGFEILNKGQDGIVYCPESDVELLGAPTFLSLSEFLNELGIYPREIREGRESAFFKHEPLNNYVKDKVLSELSGLGFNFRLKNGSTDFYTSKCPEKHKNNDRTKVSLNFGYSRAFIKCEAVGCVYSNFEMAYEKENFAPPISSKEKIKEQEPRPESSENNDLKKEIESLRNSGAEHLDFSIVPDFCEEIFEKVLETAPGNKKIALDLLLQNFLSFGGFLASHFATFKNIISDVETEPMLYFLTFSASTSGKSFLEKIIWGGFDDFLIEKSIEKVGEFKKYKNALKRYNAVTKNNLAEIGDEPKPPMLYKVKTADFTVQSLRGVVHDSSPIVISTNSEAGAIINGFGMGKDQISKTITTLSDIWSKGSDSSSRANKSDEYENPNYSVRLNINWTCQHGYSKKFLENNEIITQGLIGRFLIKKHKEEDDYTAENNITLNVKFSDFFEFYKKDLEIRYQEFEVDFKRRSIVSPSYVNLNFSELARKYYLNNIRPLKEKKRELFFSNKTLLIFYNRYNELFTRICGALHFLHRLKETEPIQTETVKMALLVMNFYELSVLELYGEPEEEREVKKEEEYYKKLIERCRKRYPKGFTKRGFCRLNSHKHAELKDYFEDALLKGEIYEEAKGLYKFSSIMRG